MIRAAEERVEHAIGILQDLQGPKIRLATFAAADGIELRAGDIFRLTTDDSPGDSTRCGTTLPSLIHELEPEQRLLLNDGLVALRVVACEREALVCRVEVGGPLSNHKGINVPDADLSVPAMSEKDRADLALGVELGVDWVALSFVRTADDLRQARSAMADAGSGALLMAKIEKPGAVARFGDLLELVDGVMVARGDLGVELPPEEVPVVQKRLITACLDAGKPVVVATQMLESMIQHPRPTRAEASDVANAVWDLSDALMLSGETAIGRYPVQSVAMMERIILRAEQSITETEHSSAAIPETDDHSYVVALAARRIVESDPNMRGVACFTKSGYTAMLLSKVHPNAPIFGISPSEPVCRRLALARGVIPIHSETVLSSEELLHMVDSALLSGHHIAEGDEVVVVASLPIRAQGTTNFLKLSRSPDGGTIYAYGARLGQTEARFGSRTTEAVLCVSEDGGHRWSAPRVVPFPGDRLEITHGVLALPGGRLLAPAASVEPGRPGERVMTVVSTDGGATWPHLVEVFRDPAGERGYLEHKLALRRS